MNETLEAMAQAIFMDWFLRHSDGLTRSRVSDQLKCCMRCSRPFAL
jgi:hypothetical protein